MALQVVLVLLVVAGRKLFQYCQKRARVRRLTQHFKVASGSPAIQRVMPYRWRTAPQVSWATDQRSGGRRLGQEGNSTLLWKWASGGRLLRAARCPSSGRRIPCLHLWPTS